MAIKRELIQFTIVNSTDCDYNIPMLQQNVYSINATTKYSWDVTTAVLSCGTGTIVVNSITYPLSYTATLTGLLSALNALGFGFFCTETISGSTYIYVVDDTNIYGDLDLCPSGITTTTTTTTTTAGTTTSTTTSTTTGTPTTSTTTTSTTAPSTSTTTTTTTGLPTTSTTTTTTTGLPTTSTTTTSTTAPSTSTTTTTTTGVPTTSTTSTTTTDVPTTTSTTTSTTTLVTCNNYQIEGAPSIDVEWLECDGTTNSATVTTAILICAQTGSVTQTGGAGNIVQLGTCTAPPTTSTTTTTTTAVPPTTSTTTSTTTSAFVTFTLAYSNVDGATACSNYPTIDTTLYYATAGSILQNGTIIYTDTALTTPAPNGFYSNGVNYWNTGAGAGNLQNQTSCGGSSTTTTTSTTTAPPTTTSTTTSTTTTLSFLIGFGGAYEDACGFLASATVTGDNPDFCSCTTFTGSIFSAAATGTWYVSFGGQYVSVSVINGNPVATVTSSCSSCTPPTTTTTTTTTTVAPTTTSTTTSTTTAALLRTFRINNTDTVNSIELDVQVDSVQVISPTIIPSNTVVTLTPQVNCAGFTNVTLEYQLVSGYTPSSASFSNGSGTYTGTIAGGFITFTGVDLTANTNQDLTVNP